MAAHGRVVGSARSNPCVSRHRTTVFSQLRSHRLSHLAKHNQLFTSAVLPRVFLPRQPVQHKRQACLQRRQATRLRAAADIALSGPSGHAESIRVPESGLLKSSWLKSNYDAEIFGLAIPALGSILLDPLLSLVDTGKRAVLRELMTVLSNAQPSG